MFKDFSNVMCRVRCSIDIGAWIPNVMYNWNWATELGEIEQRLMFTIEVILMVHCTQKDQSLHKSILWGW